MNPATRWYGLTLVALVLFVAPGVARGALRIDRLPTLHAGNGFAQHHPHRKPNGDEPLPIPGGIAIPGGPTIHVFAPGPPELGLMGLDVEPNVITDFNGFAALAYPAGTATDQKGNTFDMANDIRVYRGDYVGADGKRHHGTFGFI